MHDTLIGLARRSTTGKLFLMHSVSIGYPVQDSERFRVFDLGGTAKPQKMKTVALEVLASPNPVLYTHLIRAADLQSLWQFGVLTVPVIHNSSQAWQDPPAAYNHVNVPFVVAVSEAVAAQLRAAGCDKPVVVIRHELQRWLTQEEFLRQRELIRRRHGIGPDVLLIGMVGQFKAQKAYTRAVKVLHRVQQFRRAKLMILGGWDHAYGSGRTCYTATCRMALDLGVMPDLIMPGAINPVEPYYCAFDVFMNTSIYEGLSVATLEAIQAGCTVVTADAGGQREALPPDAALVEDSSDIEAYVAAIRRACERTERAVSKPPMKPDSIPRLWCLLAEYGVDRPRKRAQPRADTLFLTSNLNPGGAQRSLANLLCHLPPGHRAFLCILAKVLGDGYLRSVEGSNVPVFALDYKAGLLDRIERVLDMIEKLGARTLCFWNLDPEVKLLLTKVLGQRSLRIIDVSPGPMLFRELEQTADFQRRISWSLEQYFQRLDHFVAKYEGGGPPARYGPAGDKVCVIRNGVPLPLTEAQTDAPARSLRPAGADPALALVTCCRVVPNKRLEWLIEMMSALTARVPGATLTVVGGLDQRHLPYWDALTEKLKASGLTNVHFVGGRADVFSFLRQFRCFVMISHAQGCPNASLEAMAAGLPVIANDDGGTAEQIEHGVNGFLVSGDDPAEMALRAEFLLRNPDVADSFGRAARELVQRNFSMKSMVAGYMRLLAPPELDESTSPDELAIAL